MTVPVLDPIRAFPLIYCNEGSMPEVFLVPGGHYVLVNLRSEHEVMLFRLDATDSTKLATLILEDLPYYVGDIKVVEGGDIVRLLVGTKEPYVISHDCVSVLTRLPQIINHDICVRFKAF